MKKFCVAVFVLVLAAAVVAGQAPTSPPAQESSRGDSQFRLSVDRVPVLFTALDQKDRFVKDLTREEVNVFDSKKKQEIVDFARETDLPLRVGLLIDTSNSIRDRFKFELEAAAEFLNSILQHKDDRAFLISFDTNTELVQDFTNDMEKLTNGLRSLRPGGGTALFDAVYHASRDKLLGDQTPVGVRRVIVVISDGDDNQSRVSREDALAMAQRAEVTIYAISTNISRIEEHGDKVMKRFAEETGGRMFSPFRMTDLTRSFEQIGQELRSQYALLFRPTTPRDGAFHNIEVVSLRKGVKVRARKGYFAVRGE
jgi:Ca-activated chloride channel homolog